MVAVVIMAGNVILVDDPPSAVKRDVRNRSADIRRKRTDSSRVIGCHRGIIAAWSAWKGEE